MARGRILRTGARSRWSIASAAAIVAAAAVVSTAQESAELAMVGRYAVVVVSGDEDWEQKLEVRDRGRVVFDAIASHRLAIGGGLNAAAVVQPGADVDGNGTPDVVVFGWSGGAHCCFDAWVVECADSVRLVAQVAGGNGEPRFANLDDDPALEVETIDDVFAYWPASYAGSPAPRVVLDWQDGRLVPSCALTFQPPPRDLEARIAAVRADPLWREIPDEGYASLFREVVDLYYAGQETAALRLFDAARPPGDARALALLVEMGARMGRSPYWPTLNECRDGSGGAR